MSKARIIASAAACITALTFGGIAAPATMAAPAEAASPYKCGANNWGWRGVHAYRNCVSHGETVKVNNISGGYYLHCVPAGKTINFVLAQKVSRYSGSC